MDSDKLAAAMERTKRGYLDPELCLQLIAFNLIGIMLIFLLAVVCLRIFERYLKSGYGDEHANTNFVGLERLTDVYIV